MRTTIRYIRRKSEKTTDIEIDRLRLEKGKKFSLHYDFGDDWMFVINVQKIDEEKEYSAPYVIRGNGNVVQYPNYDDIE